MFPTPAIMLPNTALKLPHPTRMHLTPMLAEYRSAFHHLHLFFSVCEVHTTTNVKIVCTRGKWHSIRQSKVNHQLFICFIICAGVSSSRFRPNSIPPLLVPFPMGVVEVVGACVFGVDVAVLLQVLPWKCSRGLLRNALT